MIDNKKIKFAHRVTQREQESRTEKISEKFSFQTQ